MLLDVDVVVGESPQVFFTGHAAGTIAMFFPPAVMMTSFFRPTIFIKPSSIPLAVPGPAVSECRML
jgi:hypothetical protein